ncbi:putative protein conserved in bacteria, partial [Dysosmobacter welbionis]
SPFFSLCPSCAICCWTATPPSTAAVCPPCKAASWTFSPSTAPGWTTPVCSRRPPFPSSPTSRSTIPPLHTRVCWPSPATTASSRWPMCSSPRSRWNTSLKSSGKRAKSPSSWTNRRRWNAAGCCLPSLLK